MSDPPLSGDDLSNITQGKAQDQVNLGQTKNLHWLDQTESGEGKNSAWRDAEGNDGRYSVLRQL